MYSLKLYNSPCQSMSVCPGYTYVIYCDLMWTYVWSIMLCCIASLFKNSWWEQSAIPQLRSHDSRTKTTRFQNQTTRFPNQSRRASTTTFSRFHNHTLTIPQPKCHDSTTKISSFHNQTPTIPQPKPQDSTTNNYWFHQEDCRYLLSL